MRSTQLAVRDSSSGESTIGVERPNGRQRNGIKHQWSRSFSVAGRSTVKNNLGVRYGAGRSVPQDDAEAVRWYRLAAEQGDANVQYNLGVRYDDGLGVPLDDAEAVVWYRRAAEQGHVSAQHNLGVMYSNGEGVPQDNVEAHMWSNLAASRSTGEEREMAVTLRDAVAARMTPADLSEAQRRAREWHEAHQVP